MNWIKLTNHLSGKPIYLNVEMIGDIIQQEPKEQYGNVVEEPHTRIGHLTHNNGGFRVKENADDIIQTLVSMGVITTPVIVPQRKTRKK